MTTNYAVGENRVTFFSADYQIVALLFLPPNFSSSESYPAVTITPPVTGVKEQTVSVYARALALQGYVTITYDQRGWGESEGPTFRANPYEFIEDVRSAVSFLRTLPFVDNDSIHGMGICIGSGIAAVAAAYDGRVKSLAVVSAYLEAGDIAFSALGAKGLREMMAGLAPARDALFQNNETVLIKPVPETEQEVENEPDPVAVGMRDYYLPGMPGSTLNWHNRISPISYESVLSFSVFHHIRMFEAIPTFHAYGSEAISRHGAERFFNEASGPKKRLIIEGAGHFDMYWRPECVNPTVEAISAFFANIDA
ncbi:dienelactone hydrolase [Grimontia indica]|uniref:Dienelactone hydrolase n=1 Tax=Grimontia indica TaxID=1056512 RepID=R1GTQ1_9GAMM|nr:alpha/beta hydrolase [Grimontia indica]EOD79424.1 dienelactone hydrolase [Grimontia indica]